MSAVAKPRLRGLGMRAWTYSLYSSLVGSAIFAVWFKVNILEARKKHYKDFYDNYDDDKAFEGMKAAGVFKGFEA